MSVIEHKGPRYEEFVQQIGKLAEKLSDPGHFNHYYYFDSRPLYGLASKAMLKIMCAYSARLP